MQDDLGILYCLGRDVGAGEHEVVATYYRSDGDYSTKRSLDDGSEYSRFVYQGLPEERNRLATVHRPEVVDRLLEHTVNTEVGIYLAASTLAPGRPEYTELDTWLASEHPGAGAYQSALQIACTSLSKAEVTIDELSLYGAAAFGLVATTGKIVDDIDVVFRTANLPELREAIEELKTAFTWEEIDPHRRLLERRQLLKAKRWSTSQIRLTEPYPMSIDLKVGREPGMDSLWDTLPTHGQQQPYTGELRVVDDTEGYCTSPSVRCEDRNGDERILLMEGYQYIGCAVVGDVIKIKGNAYVDSSVIIVSQSNSDNITPDFRNVPVS